MEAFELFSCLKSELILIARFLSEEYEASVLSSTNIQNSYLFTTQCSNYFHFMFDVLLTQSHTTLLNKKTQLPENDNCVCDKCDPDGILTHDLQNRNLTLYTAELRSLFCDCKGSKLFEL